MTLEVNKNIAFYEFEWVIRILDSAESESQMGVVQNCFSVWEKKYMLKKLKADEIIFLNSLKSNYWAKFKNKIFKIGATSYIHK
jgi:hypothetical protein